MLEGIESRGGDATGFAAIRDSGELQVEKAAITSDKFIKKKCFKELGKDPPRSLIMHTRKQTKGAASNNDNNHPIWVKGEGIALVHNGMIGNDDDVFEHLKMDRIAEVDSETLAQIFAKEGDFEKGIEMISKTCTGTVAFAMLNSKYPDHLYLGRNINPVELLLDTKRDILFFSSLSASVHKACQVEKEVKRWRGFSTPNFGKLEQPTMDRDSAYDIGPKRIEKVLEFDTLYTNPFEKKKESWSEWRKRFNRGKGKVRAATSPDPEKYAKWDKLDNGHSIGTCDFCQIPGKPLRYIHKAGISMCKLCYSTTIIDEDTVAMIKCDRCYAQHAEADSIDHAVYDMNTDKSKTHQLCPTCWEQVRYSHCMLCGKYTGIVNKFQEGVGYLCIECNAGQYGA